MKYQARSFFIVSYARACSVPHVYDSRNRHFRFKKRGQLFIGVHNETLSVASSAVIAHSHLQPSNLLHSNRFNQRSSQVILTFAPWHVTTVRNTVTLAPKALLISIFSPRLPPMQPRLRPVCAGTSSTNPSAGPVEPLPLNWLGGVIIWTPPCEVSTFLAQI
jgi:hypothetical protein